MKFSKFLTVLFLCVMTWTLSATDTGGLALDVHVADEEGHAVAAAVVLVEPHGLWSMTDEQGNTVLRKIPFHPGSSYRISVSILGYKTWTMVWKPDQEKIWKMKVELVKESIAMDEVVVVAENKKSGESTASKIGRMAIDHLQATSLTDLLQLVPGQISMSNPSLTRPGTFSTRTLFDNPGATSILMDGVPVSGNADFNGNNGVDLRSIGTDNIQSVEIVRGIASAEYGDVSSGTMIVNSKIGVTDLNVRGKIMPGIMQFYAGKGFKAGHAGNFNLSADYAHGKSDPRYLTDTYGRILGNVSHNIQVLQGRWDLTTKLSFTGTRDWSGADAAEPEELKKYYDESKFWSLNLNHSGRVNLNRLFSRTLKYDIAFQYSSRDTRNEHLDFNPRGYLPDATVDGLHVGETLPRNYETTSGIISRPMSLFAKISDHFHLDKGRFMNHFNIGMEYRAEGNEGIGHYDSGRYHAFPQARLRRFCDIPWLHQFSVYAEDRITIPLSCKDYPRIRGQVGVRWTMIQPGRPEFMNTWSPRINLSLDVTEWCSIRGGFGQSEKLPSLQYLYPDNIYSDWLSIAVTDGNLPFFLYSTRVEKAPVLSLKPMRNNKSELGLDFRPNNGMSFSVVGFFETTKNAFSMDNSFWTAYSFPEWDGSDVTFNENGPVYDPANPSRMRTVIANLERPGNTGWERNWGVEYDFDFGKIRATNTAFYLNGAYTDSSQDSYNCSYRIPIGKNANYSDIYLVYPQGTGNQSERRRFSTALRIVQHIPAIRFVVSATAQFVFYDYRHNIRYGEVPIGYLTDDNHPEDWTDGRGGVSYTPFTREQLADPDFEFEGYRLADQLAGKLTENLPTLWPPVWTLNLRVTKEIGDFMGFSFYVNNMLFHQPWQKTSTSPLPVERNGSLFSYGLELFLHF